MSVAIARRLPPPVVAGWLAVAAVLALVLPTLRGIAAVHAGSALLRMGTEPESGPFGRGGLTTVAWVTDAALGLALTRKARSWLSACRRRSAVDRLIGRGDEPALGEATLIDELGVGSRRALDRSFAELADWFSEFEDEQHRHPGLALVRTPHCKWVQICLLALDAAALTAAAAPSWAPPNTHALLRAGTRCLRSVSAQLGLTVPEVVVSLHGLEERMFADTFHYLFEGGLAVECSRDRTWSSFQGLRVQYAPHAAALNEALGYRDYATAGMRTGEDLAGRLRLLSS